MDDILIYTGLGITIIGWLIFVYVGGKFMSALKDSENQPIRLTELRRNYRIKKNICRLLMMAGIIVTIIGCYI